MWRDHQKKETLTASDDHFSSHVDSKRLGLVAIVQELDPVRNLKAS